MRATPPPSPTRTSPLGAAGAGASVGRVASGTATDTSLAQLVQQLARIEQRQRAHIEMEALRTRETAASLARLEAALARLSNTVNQRLQAIASQVAKAHNPHTLFFTRFSALPLELAASIFAWIHPRHVLRYARLSRACRALLSSSHFAALNLKRFSTIKDAMPGTWPTEFDRLWLYRWPAAYQTIYADVYLAPMQELVWEGILLKGSLPLSIGRLSSLSSLVLSQTSLTGAIPTSLGNLQNLINLDLSYNDFSGPIPASLQRLIKLERLYLYDNNFTGPLPAFLGSLPSLTALALDNNAFEPGPIPDTFQNLQRLAFLDLRCTNRTGKLPPWLGRLTCLKRLDISGNRLHGSLPAQMAHLARLEVLEMEENDVGGVVLEEVCAGLVSLTDLSLDVGKFVLPLPERWAALLGFPVR